MGDQVFLNVSPIKVVRFDKKGKMAPHYVSPYEILKRVGSVAFELALLSDFPLLHSIFHMSLLQPYIYDPPHVSKPQSIQLNTNLS